MHSFKYAVTLEFVATVGSRQPVKKMCQQLAGHCSILALNASASNYWLVIALEN